MRRVGTCVGARTAGDVARMSDVAEGYFGSFRLLARTGNFDVQLSQLVKIAALASGGDLGAIVASSPVGIDAFGAFNFKAKRMSKVWDFKKAGYRVDRFHSTTDIAPGSYIERRGRTIFGRRLTAFARAPVLVSDPFLTVALIVACTRPPDAIPFGWPEGKARRMLEEVASLAANLLNGVAFLARAEARRDATTEAFGKGLGYFSYPAALFDRDRRCLAANSLFRVLLDVMLDAGSSLRRITQFVPYGAFSDADDFNAACVEVIADAPDLVDGGFWNVSWTKVHPVDRTDPLLLVTVQDGWADADARDGLESALPAFNSPGESEPTFRFLQETLATRLALRQRNDSSYLTVRTWRKPIKTWQLDALRALKAYPPLGAVRAVAAEIKRAVDQVIGVGAFGAIVPMPGGHSGQRNSFSVRIAAELAKLCDRPLIRALALRPHPGSSHPKANVDRPPLELVQSLDQSALLVDDVATSGRHLEEGVTLLRRSAPSVFAVAWIGGETTR